MRFLPSRAPFLSLSLSLSLSLIHVHPRHTSPQTNVMAVERHERVSRVRFADWLPLAVQTKLIGSAIRDDASLPR